MTALRPPRAEFRITKYNPADRNENGHYLKDDWTMFADVARGTVSEADYLQAEAAYINAATMLLRDDGVTQLSLADVENGQDYVPPPPNDVVLDDLQDVLRPVLRTHYWAKLQSGRAFIHVGWDFYMYVGVDHFEDSTLSDIEAMGLFVELFPSPYLQNEDAS